MDKDVPALYKRVAALLLAALLLAAIPLTAEAFKVTIDNKYNATKSFAILKHDDKLNKWVCIGWYNVGPKTVKNFTFLDSTKVKHAYIYSSAWSGSGEGAMERMVIKSKFKYYDGEQCPPGDKRRKEFFSRVNIGTDGTVRLVWQAAPAAITGDERLGIDLLNRDREKQGLPRLSADAKLSQVARKHAKDMAQNKYFSHTNRKGQSPFDRMKEDGITYRSAAENIAYNSSIAAMQAAWMNSPGHRTNILNSQYTHVGLGLYTASDGTIYGVQLFARY
ncbi:CAP domain-containing protein [Sporomusa sphaeroides]|uniref:Cysteine-rich secretory protein family protein n=2 Tax=Sporomusa TaxID=2375 RepID=A0ABM9W0L1_9FIRM|nr:CAP domain-containing protein [Sporomusa sphaeroides]OLS56751.1 cysteine-rich secretory protein family protein [Sporomusa sphaeroides DSM 2875]CVK18698.1 Cysteine-rich secretory protein family protein [Sporomusa sphaeroides DSM 2875]SCM81987.1 exported hypothetical protein [uncultured Sporomusa sp.]